MKLIKSNILQYLLIGLLLIGTSCKQKPSTTNPNFSENILLNQMGYVTNESKKALITADVNTFELVDVNDKVVFEGNTGDSQYWELAGNSVRLADFSSFTKNGEYQISINNTEFSSPFVISNNPYKGLADAALKSYYYARCGVDIEEQFGGKWNWKAGHPDTEVMIHASAADKNRPEGTIISSPGGWYDAGDYGKYIVNSSITTWTILQSLALNNEFHKNQNLNIPESGNELPDVLDEALVNLKWMMTMQDPNDGGLYHKLTTKNFDSFIMPGETDKQRYVVQKSTSVALDYASTMAAASRIIRKYGLNDLADKMKISAEQAWNWALANPEVFYIQPDDISTGAYGDTSLVDEWFWAAAEMYLLTSEKQALSILNEKYKKPITPKWDLVNTLGVISLLTSDKRNEFKEIEKDFLAYVNEMLEKEKACPYLISMDKFAWGSNSDVANDGMLKLVAMQLTGNTKYLKSARNDLDYILGRNATGYSFVTGFGHLTPMFPHNRIMSADGIEEPMPGYLAGGPNTNVFTDCDQEKVKRSKFPAASYTDTECSYSTNETAINWNAPLVFLSSGIEAMNK
jgi:endoglucanase